MHDILTPLLDDLVGDERNVLLTPARMTVTCETGHITSKDQAAAPVLCNLQEPYPSVMKLAVGGYLGQVHDDWSGRQDETPETASHLARQVRCHLRTASTD